MASDAVMAQASTNREAAFDLICESIEQRGYPPTISELATRLGVGTLTVRRYLDHLVAEGRIARESTARGIRLVTPDEVRA